MIFDLEFKRRNYKRKGRKNIKPGVLPISIKKMLMKESSIDILSKNGIDRNVNLNNYLRNNSNA